MIKISSFNCSIGIVTYLERFEKYFKPLMRQLYLLFPDYDINVFVNGHYNTLKQVRYLKEITAFLRSYPNTRYLTNIKHQSLARGWNWLILMARYDKVLILNDDVSFNWGFRYHLENLRPTPGIFTLNNTWSHFVISQDVIRKVGWFDERYLGVGFEDTDYAIRLIREGIPLEDQKIQGLRNLHDNTAPPEEAGWSDISGLTLNKYSQINWEFFKKKWGIPHMRPVSEPDFIKIKAVENEWFIQPNPYLAEVPEFYPLASLETTAAPRRKSFSGLRTNLARICSFASSVYWQARQTLVGWLRYLCGRHWEKLRIALIIKKNGY
jgi:hypothetical protein